MSSPDAFERRIAAAAKELRRPAPAGLFESVRARARDPEASIAAAARALASQPEAKAPTGALAGILAQLDDSGATLAAAARSVAPRVPAEAEAKIRAAIFGTARARPRLRRLLLRSAMSLAAALLLGITLFLRFGGPAQASPNPALLTSAALEQSRAIEEQLGRETQRLVERVAAAPHVAGNETAQPLLEEVAFLDQAIDECRGALAENARHSHLRQRMVELAERRVELLRQIEALGYAAGGDAAGDRG